MKLLARTGLLLIGTLVFALVMSSSTMPSAAAFIAADQPASALIATIKPTVAPTVAVINCPRVLIGGSVPRLPPLDVSKLARCRPPASSVIKAIRNNGPFNFARDDIVFGNFEGRLPPAPRGTYHEYTVPTTGASTRGARRIITSGAPNRKASQFKQMYYTDDHYETFWLVIGLNK